MQIKKIKDDIVLMVAGGRYMILLMSLFAIYSGFLYNDFFSLGLDLFGTRYIKNYQEGDQIYVIDIFWSILYTLIILP